MSEYLLKYLPNQNNNSNLRSAEMTFWRRLRVEIFTKVKEYTIPLLGVEYNCKNTNCAVYLQLSPTYSSYYRA